MDETFVAILDFERERDLAIAAAEAAVLACLIFAPWSPRAARACLAPFLSRQSAEAAVCAAARVRQSSAMAKRFQGR